MGRMELPSNVYELKQLVLELQKNVKEKEAALVEGQSKISRLQDLVNLLQKRKFAPQSEVISSEQLGLFNEVEDLIHTPPEEEDDEETQSEAEEDLKNMLRKKKTSTSGELASGSDSDRSPRSAEGLLS